MVIGELNIAPLDSFSLVFILLILENVLNGKEDFQLDANIF